MDPTDEQAEAIRLFSHGKTLAIEAGAGTGKTSTLVMIAKSAPGDRGQYVAFNRALVEESKTKFPFDVACNTAHSLAYRAVGKNYQHRLNGSYRMKGYEIAARLNLSPEMVLDFQGKEKVLAPGLLASLAQQTVTKFCQTADQSISWRHVPYLKGIDNSSAFGVRERLVMAANEIWHDVQQMNGWAPFKHEHYLKMWQLTPDPRIMADYILFDEAQDANPVIADVIARQQAHGTQLVYVGDSQQEIYGWTGAVNALASVKAEARTYLTQSFRFGQAVADRANEVLESIALNEPTATLRLSGNPAIESRLERLDQPRAILVRTNAQGLTDLLKLQEGGRLAHFLGATTELLNFTNAAGELQAVGRTSHPDLFCFDSWQEVQAYTVSEESGGDLNLMVRLVDNFGVAEIQKAIRQMPNEDRAEVVISTAHKAKGREWESVQLGPDFPAQADSSVDDLRLLYVAVTRAKVVLDDTALSEGD